MQAEQYSEQDGKMISLPEVARIVADARLTADAVRIILHVAAKGPGRHEIPFEELSILLGNKTDKPVRAAVNLARHCGYLVWGKGGGGRPNWYQFVGGEPGVSRPATRVGASSESETVSEPAPSLNRSESELSPSLPTRVGVGSESESVSELAPSQKKSESEQAPSLAVSVGASSESESSRSAVPILAVEEEEVGGGVTPPIVPPNALDPRAEEAIARHGDLFRGCRGALRDYLRARVQPWRQYAYVQTLAGWLNDLEPVWRLPDGSSLPPHERTRMLAAALNDLAASDETKMIRPVGEPANLRTKLNILLKKRGAGDVSRNDRRGSAAESGRGSAAACGSGAAADYAHLG